MIARIGLSAERLTGAGNGMVIEVENVLARCWLEERRQPSRISVGSGLMRSFNDAIFSGQPHHYITEGSVGGYLTTVYRSRFSGAAIPVGVHAEPQDTVLFEFDEEPKPATVFILGPAKEADTLRRRKRAIDLEA